MAKDKLSSLLGSLGANTKKLKKLKKEIKSITDPKEIKRMTNAINKLYNTEKRYRDKIENEKEKQAKYELKLQKQMELAEQKAAIQKQRDAQSLAKTQKALADANLKNQKRQQAKEARERKKQEAEVKRWEQNRAGGYSSTTRFNKAGLAYGTASWSGKFKAGEDLMARQGLQNALAKLKQRPDFKSTQSIGIRTNADGTISAGVSVNTGDKEPLMSRIRPYIAKLGEIIGKVVGFFKKLVGGLKSVLRGITRFGKALLKIGIGLPLFNALFSKLAALNGLNRFQFIGAGTGKGDATTARQLSRAEQIWGTDGSLTGLTAKMPNLLSDPSRWGGLAPVLSPDKMKQLFSSGNSNTAAIGIVEEAINFLKQTAGTSNLRQALQDGKLVGAERILQETGFYGKTGLSLNSLLGYNDIGMDNIRRTMENKQVKWRISDEGKQAERKYQLAMMGFENVWIKFATAIEPYMSIISDEMQKLANVLIDVMFNNGGFKKIMGLLMDGIKWFGEYLRTDGIKTLETFFNWLGEKVGQFANWLTNKNENGITGFDKVKEFIDNALGVFDYVKELLKWTLSKLESVAGVLGLETPGNKQQKRIAEYNQLAQQSLENGTTPIIPITTQANTTSFDVISFENAFANAMSRFQQNINVTVNVDKDGNVKNKQVTKENINITGQ